jgi:hypothetical protein
LTLSLEDDAPVHGDRSGVLIDVGESMLDYPEVDRRGC